VSADDPFALKMAKRMPVTLTTFGQHEDADVRISEISFYTLKNKVLGMQAKVSGSVGKGKLVVKGAIGYQQALPAAAAVAGAHALGIALKDALSGLDAYDAPPGRGRLLNAKNDSLLIDDSYNASPAAVEEVLRTLKDFPGAKRRIAVIGDMLELGRYSVSEHARIGKLAFESADIVISVGIRAREVQATKHFNTAWDAASDLTKMIEPGDVVLIKGSQSIRMERIVEALLADKADQKRLVRQEPEWKRLA
jgi:UDP-N-acetylmuramoyl-tripeptide--D-alanyl-D-alanine ligase